MNFNDILLREDISHVKQRLAARLVQQADCLVWTGATGRRGYGLISVGGRLRRAHRLAWLLTNGPVPDGLLILHRCDNPPCCNPAHLFAGTHQDNMDDMIAKGRARNMFGELAGTRNYQHMASTRPRAKLNADVVESIRKDPRSNADIARELGVARSTVWKARKGFWWAHVV